MLCVLSGGLVAVLLMDTIGRRPLLLSGGVVGTVAWGTLAGLMGAYGSARELDKHGLVPLLLAMSALTSVSGLSGLSCNSLLCAVAVSYVSLHALAGSCIGVCGPQRKESGYLVWLADI